MSINYFEMSNPRQEIAICYLIIAFYAILCLYLFMKIRVT